METGTDFNSKFLEANKATFDTILEKLRVNSDQKELYEKLDNYMELPDTTYAKELQKILGVATDGLFGPVSLAALAKIAGISYTPAVVPARTTSRTSRITPGSALDPRDAQASRTREALSSGNISFARSNGDIVLNARDKDGKIVQRLTYADLMGTKTEKMSEARKEELTKLILLSTIADIWIQSASKDRDSLLGGSMRT